MILSSVLACMKRLGVLFIQPNYSVGNLEIFLVKWKDSSPFFPNLQISLVDQKNVPVIVMVQ